MDTGLCMYVVELFVGVLNMTVIRGYIVTRPGDSRTDCATT